MGHKDIKNQVLSLYSGVSFLEKLHMVIRFERCPFEKLEGYLPKEGKVADLGCGHGLFANLLSLSSEDRQVLGVDPSSKKIEAAKESIKGRRNIKFIQGYLEDVKETGLSAITILDVLYLVPYGKQGEILKKGLSMLDNAGVILIKEVPASGSLRFKLAYLQELVMVRLLKRTMGGEFYYRTLEGWLKLFQDTGCSCQPVKLDTPMPSYLFILRKI